MNDLTLAYFTARKDPKIDWFITTLKEQLKGRRLGQLIVVDYYAEMPGRDEPLQMPIDFADIFTYTPPKPCVMQGKHRLTKNEHFAASNARNTAFALCKNNYIVCVDDLSVLMSGWLDNVQHAMENKYIVCGAYQKVKNLSLDDKGKVVYDTFPPGRDSRMDRGSVKGIVPWHGRDFYGCSFGIPIEAVLKVNGFSEDCDFQGAEDYDFGIRLERAGYKIFYNINMMTFESEEFHHTEGNAKFIRQSKISNWQGQRMMSDHVMLNRVLTDRGYEAYGNRFKLSDLRKNCLTGLPFPIPTEPTKDWRDGQELSSM